MSDWIEGVRQSRANRVCMEMSCDGDLACVYLLCHSFTFMDGSRHLSSLSFSLSLDACRRTSGYMSAAVGREITLIFTCLMNGWI